MNAETTKDHVNIDSLSVKASTVDNLRITVPVHFLLATWQLVRIESHRCSPFTTYSSLQCRDKYWKGRKCELYKNITASTVLCKMLCRSTMIYGLEVYDTEY
jgi:hypothetical protein